MATSTTRTDLTARASAVPEKSTSLLSGQLVDETGAAIPAAQLTTFALTLYAVVTSLPIINSVSAVNILNTGRGTVDGSGNWTITLTPADNAIVGTDPGHEVHRALLEWTWNGGLKGGKHEVDFLVRNLDKVT